ncbi:DNA-binding protein RFXANK-like [Neodiprion virginianus]|uniref:DNA-binding protein RFXANK-like n=1 Tax=Neodiprion fabricii TaxID=2872261 RepID=UPI001ED8E227|nr:DNA-binding protein RFXANK-like [Neodiprion fabricii]XP_046627554.1 DNA-binding protein RFXANK-like [Neodiprion virginianus]
MNSNIHSELILKSEEEDIERQDDIEEEKLIINAHSECKTEQVLEILPRPLVCKPENINVDCKTEPIETKWHWAPGAWQDATRTSAFQPYKPPTLLTNLQRGNTQTEIPQLYEGNDLTFHTLAGQGELTPNDVQPGTVDVPDEKGFTALMWAAGYGQLGSAKQLLNAGADKNYRGVNGETALHLAAAYGHHDLVKLLLNHGARADPSDEEGNTPLVYGAHGDHPHVCHELLSRGADVTHRNVHNVTPYQAALANNATIAKAVIENFLMHQLMSLPSDAPNL